MCCLHPPDNMWIALLGRPHIYMQHLGSTFFTANSPQIRFANSPLEWPLGNIRILRNHLREVMFGRSS